MTDNDRAVIADALRLAHAVYTEKSEALLANGETRGADAYSIKAQEARSTLANIEQQGVGFV